MFDFRMFECLVTCFLRVMVSLLCRLQAVSKIRVPIYPCLIISEGRLNSLVSETATLRKHVTKYKHMRKLMLVFLGKFENRGIKIARVNSISNTKYTNLLLPLLPRGGVYHPNQTLTPNFTSLVSLTQVSV